MLPTRLTAVLSCVAASTVGGLLLASRTAAQSPPASAPRPSDPLDLFAELMPVFSHPRCVNCHSEINPRDETDFRNHPGGFVRSGETCTAACHDAEPDWTRVAPPSFKFAGLDTKAMCLLQQNFVKNRSAGSWLSHLSTDALIGAGFKGWSGGAATAESKPQMERVEFVEKAANWIQLGAASCGSWEGVITQTESLDGTHSYAWTDFAPPSSIGVVEEAQRVLTVERKSGRSTIKLHVDGHQEMTRIAYIPLNGGLCKNVYQDNFIWAVRETGPLPADVKIQIEQDGKYTIQFIGPNETTQQANSSTFISDCASLPPSEPQPDTILSWDPWKFTISCPPRFTQDVPSGNFIDCDLFDAQAMPRLKGSMTRTIRQHEDAADPQSWLRVSPASGSFGDTGNSIPVKVITTWDFKLVE